MEASYDFKMSLYNSVSFKSVEKYIILIKVNTFVLQSVHFMLSQLR